MRTTLKYVLPIVFLAVATAIAMVLVASRPEAAHTPPPTPMLLVQVSQVQHQAVTFAVTSQGTVAPRTQTTLVAEAAGQIVEVSPAFVSGGFFSQGDVLLRVDPRNYESDVKRARANVARAATQLETESALAGYAAEDYERLRRVRPETGPASQLTLRKPQLRQALAELQSAEAELEKALGDLDRTVIRAPYDGLVRSKLADIGQYVNVGSQLAVTFAVDVAEVRLPVTQQDLRFLQIDDLRRGQTVPVRLTATLGDTPLSWDARITRSEGVFDTGSRVLYLVAQIEDPYALRSAAHTPLLMGTYVQAQITGRAGGELVLVPRHALQRGNTLWIVDEQQKLQPREVEVVRRDETYVYVRGQLRDGERYSITPMDQPLPGMKVRVSG